MNDTLKYLTLGILIGYLTPYLIALIKKPAAEIQNQTHKLWNLNT